MDGLCIGDYELGLTSYDIFFHFMSLLYCRGSWGGIGINPWTRWKNGNENEIRLLGIDRLCLHAGWLAGMPHPSIYLSIHALARITSFSDQLYYADEATASACFT